MDTLNLEEFYKETTELACDFSYCLHVEQGGGLSLEYTSNGFQAVTGYSMEELLPCGGLIAIAHPDDISIVVHHNSSVLSKQQKVNEFRIITRHSDTRWLRLRSKPIWDEVDRRVFRIIAVGQDITNRRVMEDDLFASEKMYRNLIHSLYNSLYDGVVVHAPDASVITCNDRAFELLDLTKDQMAGKAPFDPKWSFIFEDETIMPEDQYPVNQVIISRKPLHNYILGIKRPTKQDIIWFMVNAFPVFDKNYEVTQIVVTYIDITRRILAERSLKDSEEKFRAIFNESIDAIMIVDSTVGIIKHVNPSSLKILGYEENQLVGEPFSVLIPQSTNLHGQDFREMLKVSDSIVASQNFLRADGSLCPMDFTATFIPWGDESAVLVTLRDIFERTKAEEEKQQYTARLEVIRDIDQAILTSQTPQSIAQAALDHIRRLIPCVHGSVLIIEHQDDQIKKVTPLAQFEETDLFEGWKGIEDKQISYLMPALYRGEVHIVNSIKDLENPTCFEKFLSEKGVNSSIYIPLVVKGNLVGSLNLISYAECAFKPEQLEIILEVASSLSVAIQQAQLFEQIRLRAAELETMLHISMELRFAETRSDILTLLMRTVDGLLDPAFSGFLQLEEANLVYIYGSKLGRVFVGQNFSSSDLFLWKSMIEDEPLFISDLECQHKDAFCEFCKAQGLESMVAIPMKIKEKPIGLLLSAFKQQREFSADEKRLLTAIGELGSTALHRASFTEVLEQRVADRTRELATLYEVTLLSSKSHGLKTILEQSLEMLQKDVHCQASSIHVVGESGKLLKLVAKKGIPTRNAAKVETLPLAKVITFLNEQPETSSDDASKAKSANAQPEIIIKRFGNYFGAPMHVKGEIVGLLGVYKGKGAYFSKEEKSLLSVIADQLGIAIENARLHKREEEAAIIEERQRLARDIHDSVTQSLYSLALNADSAGKLLERGDIDRLERYLNDIKDNAYAALKEMRLLLHELRSTTSEEREGLVNILKLRLDSVERRSGMEAQLLVNGVVNLPRSVQWELYRIAIEALNNALKHARATLVIVEIVVGRHRIVLDVTDNGKGFDLNHIKAGGMGLGNMRTRAEQLGGKLDITSSPGKGTRVRLMLDYDQIKKEGEEI